MAIIPGRLASISIVNDDGTETPLGGGATITVDNVVADLSFTMSTLDFLPAPPSYAVRLLLSPARGHVVIVRDAMQAHRRWLRRWLKADRLRWRLQVRR